MGSWSPTFFGSDAALDCWSRIADTAEMAQPDGFHRTPEEWDAGDIAAFRAKATEVEAFATTTLGRCIEEARRGYGAILAALMLATGTAPRLFAMEAARSLCESWRLTNDSGRLDAAAFLENLIARPSRRAENLYKIIQYAGLEGGDSGQAEAWLSAKSAIPLLPDVYHPREKVIPEIETVLLHPGFRRQLEAAPENDPDILVWDGDATLTVMLTAIGLMAAGAEMSANFRKLALEAVKRDPDTRDDRKGIRDALQTALEIYRDGQSIQIAEETLAQSLKNRNARGLINR